MTPKIEKAIVKYITKSATASDLDILSEWIKNSDNKVLFKNYVQTHYAITFSMNNPDSKKALERLLHEIKKEKSLVYRLKNQPIFKYAAAAIIVGILTSTYIFRNILLHTQVDNTPTIVNSNSIEAGTDKATLTLEDGSQITLEKGSSVQIQNASSNGEEIIYETEKSKIKEIAYNYLTIPRGGQFFIKLSDGTQVWLNSESQLKYPVSFIEGEARTVELVYGEAYFDVSPSTEHKGSKFKVFNKSQEVEVIGTEFNIKAYKDESNIYTTLVEGKVDISIENRKQNLIPNQQLNLDTKTNFSSIKDVDVFNEISWKNGVFSFEEKSLKDIMVVLSRWYDIKVVYENNIDDDNDHGFVGIFRKNKTIEEILSNIKKSGIIKDYKINNNEIVLK
jgi:ferric-dicitrate binding protein FerR (iron transport regulator)